MRIFQHSTFSPLPHSNSSWEDTNKPGNSKLPIAESSGIFKNMIAQSEIRLLPLSQKLELLEAVWSELSSDPNTLEVPQWHKDILDERQRGMEKGSMEVIDWELAKEQINLRIR
jgi:hypothetical protein